jgi:hypothetical protein
MGSEPEKFAFADVPVGTMCWHVHHNRIAEMTYGPLLDRVEWIKQWKPESEIPIRLERMRPVRGELPPEVVDAIRDYMKTYITYMTGEWNTGSSERGAAYYLAAEVLIKTIENNQEAIEKLHREECPGCPWSWDQGTLFP